MNVQAPDGSVVQFPDGTDPNIVNSVMAKNFGPKPAYDPATDPTSSANFNPTRGTADNLLSGVGAGMTDIGVGMNQMEARNPGLAFMLNPAMLFSKDLRDKADEAATDKAKIDKPLNDTTAGKIGNIAGQAAIMAPLPAAEIGGIGKLGNVILKGAQQGAEAGAVQPVADVGNNDVSSLITGNKGTDYYGQKAKDIGEGAAAGGITGGVLSGLGTLVNKAMPGNLVSSLFNAAGKKDAASDFAKEGEDLVQRTGVQLTPGEITGNKAQISLENNSRQSIASKNIAFAADQNKVQQLNDYISNLIDNTAKTGGDPAEVGSRVQGAVKNAVNTLSQDRATQAAADYGQVNAMLKGAPAIVPQNYLQTLGNIGQELAGAPKQSDLGKISQAIGSLQKDGMQNADLPTLLKTRQFLSQVSSGQKLASGASDQSIGQQKRIATQLLSAIDNDLDASADRLGGDVGAALKQANANYAQKSQQIEGIKNMALGKLVGDDFTNAAGTGQFNKIPGEVVMQKIQSMKPSELDASVKLLQDHDPDTLQAVKRSVLESALDKAQQMAPSEGSNTLAMHPNVFVNALAKTPEDEARLRALFSPQEQSQINDALNVARRMSDKAGFNASGTAQAGEMTALGSAGTAAILGHPLPLLGLGGKMLGNRAIAQAMVNPEGRAVIQQMNRLPPGSEKFTQLSAQLAGLIGANQAEGNSGQ